MNVEGFCKLLFHVLVLSLGIVGCRSPTTSMQVTPSKTATSAEAELAADDASAPERAEARALVPVPAIPEDASAAERDFFQALQGTQPKHVSHTVEAVDTPDGECRYIASVGTGEEREVTVGSKMLSTSDCARAADIGHAATFQRWANEFGTFDQSSFAFAHDNEKLWSFGCDLSAYSATPCAEYRSYTAPSREGYDLQPRSAVGPIVSFSKSWTTVHAGGAGPSHGSRHWTFDVRTRDAAAFDAIVAPASLLEALKNDPYLQRTIGDDLQEASTIEQVWRLWGTYDFYQFGSYYFHRWSADRGRVAMRISFLEKIDGLGPNELRELGLWVTPRPEFLPHFEAAAAQDGGFLDAQR